MKKLLTGLRYFAAVLLSIVFILSVPLALVLYHLEKNVFDINLWMDELHEENAYEAGYESPIHPAAGTAGGFPVCYGVDVGLN